MHVHVREMLLFPFRTELLQASIASSYLAQAIMSMQGTFRNFVCWDGVQVYWSIKAQIFITTSSWTGDHCPDHHGRHLQTPNLSYAIQVRTKGWKERPKCVIKINRFFLNNLSRSNFARYTCAGKSIESDNFERSVNREFATSGSCIKYYRLGYGSVK